MDILVYRCPELHLNRYELGFAWWYIKLNCGFVHYRIVDKTAFLLLSSMLQANPLCQYGLDWLVNKRGLNEKYLLWFNFVSFLLFFHILSCWTLFQFVRVWSCLGYLFIGMIKFEQPALDIWYVWNSVHTLGFWSIGYTIGIGNTIGIDQKNYLKPNI